MPRMIREVVRPAAVALLLALAPQAVAAEPVSPEEFGDYAEGHTLYFERDGEPWGTEAFRPDGTVRWRYPSGECLEGVWRGHEGNVCFYYGPGTEVLCWAMRRDEPGGNIFGVLIGESDDAGLELEITGRDKRPVICTGEGVDL
jgi:hypothetical protein